MSEKVAKKARKELKEREQDFLKGMDELSRKTKIGLQPVLQFRPEGVVAAMRLVDETGKYETITPEAEKQNQIEREANSKQESVDEIEPA